MVLLLLDWLVSTSVMPLCVGAGIGAVSQLVLRPRPASLRRQAAWGAVAALGLHLILVGSGLLRDGAMLDFGAVLLAAVAASGVAAARR